MHLAATPLTVFSDLTILLSEHGTYALFCYRVFPTFSVQMDEKNEIKYFHQLLDKHNRTGNSHYSTS
jgi:hypothetical protein